MRYRRGDLTTISVSYISLPNIDKDFNVSSSLLMTRRLLLIIPDLISSDWQLISVHLYFNVKSCINTLYEIDLQT